VPSFNRARWHTLSPLLDQALDLSDEERVDWLASLRARDPSLAGEVQSLLEIYQAVNDEAFLEDGLPVLPDDLPPALSPDLSPGPSQSEQLAGFVVGAYRLISPLGEGGMGTVWLAERCDGRFEGRAAVKFLNAALMGPRGEERFRREGRILARLAHPNIARLIDAGVSSIGPPYLVLEYVDGERIDRYCDEKHLGIGARLALFRDVLAAVAHAHANLVVHRDLKPANVLVTKDGQVKLLDFGIAKLVEPELSGGTGEGGTGEESDLTRPAPLTREGAGAMTPAYAAPEQLMARPITTAADVYALGVLLYVLLTGRHPAGDARQSPAELMQAILHENPPLPSLAVRDDARLAHALAGGLASADASRRGETAWLSGRRPFSKDLDTIVTTAMRKLPEDRYASVAALTEDVRRYVDNEPIVARPATRLYRLSKFVARHRTGVVIAAAVMVTILASLGFALVQMREARRQRDAAVFEARRAEASQQMNTYLVGEARVGSGDASILERLESSRALLRQQFAGDPAIRAGLLFNVAERYAELREQQKFGDVLDEIEGIARTMDAPSLKAQLWCSRAEMKLNDGDTDGAAALIKAGFADLARDPAPRFEATINCLVVDTYHGSATSNFSHALARAREAAALHEAHGRTNADTYTDTLDALTTAYSFMGDVQNALSSVRKERAVHERLGRAGTFTHVKTRFQEATFLNRGGQRREALARSDELLAFAETRRLPTDYLHYMYRGIILMGVGRPVDAKALFDACARQFASQQTRAEEVQALTWMADALVQLGDVRAARARFDPAWPDIETQIAEGNASMTKALRVRAQLQQAEGRTAEALASIDRAVAIIDASGSKTYTGAIAVFRVAAAIALAAGDAPAALSHIERGTTFAQGDALDRNASADLGELLLLRARVLRALGRQSDARHDAAAALVHLRATLPPDAPQLREAQAFDVS
jgi:eukaryotic-like serine/threonine-protein kinase